MGRSAINAAIRKNDIDQLRYAALSAALESGNGPWAEEITYRLIDHTDSIVRGNACLSLGHIARVFGALDRKRAIETLKKALSDDDDFVRRHAQDAIDEVKWFLKRDGTPRFT